MSGYQGIDKLKEGFVDEYVQDLARKTGARYGASHVVPLAGGGDDPFMYWWTDENGQSHGYIRGSYTRKRLKP